MRCLVTGVAGFIGSHVAERLLDEGHEVVGVDCFTPYYSTALKRRNLETFQFHRAFRAVEANLAEDDLRGLVQGADWVFHLAGQPGVRASWGTSFEEYVTHNVRGTQRLLEALRTAPPLRLVYASSSSVYGDAPLPLREDGRPCPVSPYGVTKLAAEHLVAAYARSFGIPANMLRFFTVYGPRQRPDMAFNRFITAIARGEEISLFGDGTQTRDFTYVADVVEACLRAATCERTGEVLNIGGGSRVSINAVLEHLGEVLGKTPIIARRAAQRGDVAHTQAATERVGEVLGWQPAVPWREGLRRQAEWHLGEATRRAPRVSRIPTVAADRATRAANGPRIVLYGHDTYGLGHLRRNLTLATGLTRAIPDLSVLLLTGSPVAQDFAMPPRVDYIKLPTVVKVADEDYQARTLQMTEREIVALRSSLVREAIAGFAPDLVLVDHAPLGMKGELKPALRELRQQHPDVRVVLGLRDVVDEADRVRATWKNQGVYQALERLYDAILVYGTPVIVDTAAEYALPEPVAAKLRYCGYLRRDRSPVNVAALSKQLCPNGERLVVVTAGGGGDGFPLLHAYLRSLHSAPASVPTVSVVISGPFMPAHEQAALAAEVLPNEQVHLIEFTDDPLAYLQAADLVLCMGGYNTLCEVLSVGARALVLPRVEPRREQVIRAEAFAALGLVEVLQQADLAPETLARRIYRTLRTLEETEPQVVAATAGFITSGALRGVERTQEAICALLAEARTRPPALALSR